MGNFFAQNDMLLGYLGRIRYVHTAAMHVLASVTETRMACGIYHFSRQNMFFIRGTHFPEAN